MYGYRSRSVSTPPIILVNCACRCESEYGEDDDDDQTSNDTTMKSRRCNHIIFVPKSALELLPLLSSLLAHKSELVLLTRPNNIRVVRSDAAGKDLTVTKNIVSPRGKL